MNQNESNKPAGIKELAAALNISIGTVDRALHARPGVSPKTRDRVLRMAEKLRYTPNIAARSLKLNRHRRIGVFLPKEISFFFDAVRKGIQTAAQAEGASADLTFFSYPRLGEGDIEAMERANWQQFDGVIVAPGNPAAFAAISHSAKGAQNAIVFVATDAPRLHPIVSIAVDATVSGSVAADLLGQRIRTSGVVATVTGDLRIQDHSDKLRGFASALATLSSHLTLLPVIEAHDSPKDAHDATVKLIKNHKSLAGIYISTANSLPVMRALKEHGKLGHIEIIATDLFPELVEFIENGQVAATLYQRPLTQGRLAFESLSAHLNRGVVTQAVTRLAPHIVLRSNLSLFVETISKSIQFTSDPGQLEHLS